MQDRVMSSSNVSSETFTLRSDLDANSLTTKPNDRLPKPRRRRGTLFHIVLFFAAILSVGCLWAVRSIDAVEGNRDDNIVLDFTAKWCGPCQQMSPIVTKLERERLPIRKVDIDVEEDLKRQYNITSIPCFVLVSNGREAGRITGPTDEKTLRKMMSTLKASASDRPAAAAANGDNVLLDFTAKWCGPCQQMSPIISKLERENLPVRKVDIDVEDKLARQYNVSSIPCFVLVANGREINRITGVTDEKTLRSMLMLLGKPNTNEQLAKDSRSGGKLIPISNANNAVASNDRKLFPKIPPLFPKTKETKLIPTDSNDVVRGQNDDADSVGGTNDDPTLAASTRIRVKDGSKVHFGSGTIIESQPGRSVILTCGHIFRGLSKEAVIEVDYAVAGRSGLETAVGDVITYDLTSDLGLLEIPNSQPLTSIKLQPASDALVVDNKVTSIGCGAGKLPTVQKHSVTSINRYRGPDNVECTGIPQQGRSGGGLFMDSKLVGVCIAADPKDKRGIYTGLKPVEEILLKAKMGHLCSNPPAEPLQVAELDIPAAEVAPQELLFGDAPARGGKDKYASLIDEVTRGSAPSTVPADYLGAEVVCIVRPKSGAPSRVVIVNEASARFVGDLLHESGSGQDGSMTAAADNSKKAPGKKPLSMSLVKNDAKQATKKPAASKSSRSAAAMAFNSKMPESQFESTSGEQATTAIETSFEAQRYRRKRD